jgi:DNA polymerase-4
LHRRPLKRTSSHRDYETADNAYWREFYFLSVHCQIDGMEKDIGPRAIIHLDMDCFYAAIEVRDRPLLRGKPVGVGGARERRGVLTTCNYEARKFGVRSAMPTFMALQRCPNLVVVPPRFDVYRREAVVIRGILQRFTTLIEPLSLDEAYLDVTANPEQPGLLARAIRDEIFSKTNLTSSAGIGPNKLIAKIASEINKPNGQYEVKSEEVPQFMEKLPVRKIWGIGPVIEKKLEQLQIATGAELQRISRLELQELFGKFGTELYDLCRGVDYRPVEPDRERKSLSTEETFPIDLETLEQCAEQLEPLFEELMADLAQKAAPRAVTKIFLKLKFSDFSRTTIERAGLTPSLIEFRSLLTEAFARTGKAVRLIGIGVRFAELESKNEEQLRLL